jgi:hypothetical protein
LKTLEESGIIEKLFCGTDSEKKFGRSHILSEDSQESDIDELGWRSIVP